MRKNESRKKKDPEVPEQRRFLRLDDCNTCNFEQYAQGTSQRGGAAVFSPAGRSGSAAPGEAREECCKVEVRSPLFNLSCSSTLKFGYFRRKYLGGAARRGMHRRPRHQAVMIPPHFCSLLLSFSSAVHGFYKNTLILRERGP